MQAWKQLLNTRRGMFVSQRPGTLRHTHVGQKLAAAGYLGEKLLVASGTCPELT